MTAPQYKRILLKLSGEVLMGEGGLAIDPAVTARVAGEIADVKAQGYELCVVVGGGNIFRGLAAAAKGFERATADPHGDARHGDERAGGAECARTDRRFHPRPVGDLYGQGLRAGHPSPRRAPSGKGPRRHLRSGGGGALFHYRQRRGAARGRNELRRVVKGTSVDGVYDADPKKVSTAIRYETVTYDTVLAKNLKVMDASAIALCRDNHIPIVVFNIREHGNFAAVLRGEGISTVVRDEQENG